MAKFKPGIPDNFSLNVEPVRDLGDYLDEPGPTPVLPKKAKEATPAEPPAPSAPEPSAPPPNPAVTVPAPVPPTAQPPQHAAPAAPAPHAAQRVASAPATHDDRSEERGGKPKAPRREVSMSPETLRMTDELLEIIRSGSGQR